MNPTLLEILPLAHKGYCCSQILVLLALSALGRENPDLVRAAMGLCHGLGGTGGTCGILTGGCLVLGLYTGKGRDEEQVFEQADALVSDFVDWFTERVKDDYGATTCAAILNDGKPDPSRCGGLMADSWNQILELLTAYGLDPSEGRE
jgi:C_GCAxxG_C_C family probable redox protein